MRIVVLSNLYPPDVLGGYEIACAQAVDALRQRGHEVLVLTATPRKAVPTPQHVKRVFRLADVWNQYLNARMGDLALRLLFADASFVNAFNVHVMAKEITEFQPDVVYIHNIFGLGGLGLVATLEQLGVPWVWHLGDDVPTMLCKHINQIMPELVRQFGLRTRGRFIAVSSRVVEEMERDGIELSSPVEIIPYWVTGDPTPLDRSYMPDGILRVVTGGRLNPAKGIDRLIEAVANLRDEGVDNVTLDLYGTSHEAGRYPNLINRLGLGDRVRLMGFLPQRELFRRYSEYDVFAFPTWDREPFGLAPLEAAAHGGCVPLVSRSCGVGEWLVHGVHCVKTGLEPGSLERALRTLGESGADLAVLGTRARRTALRDMHIDSIVPRIEAILEDAAFESDQRGTGWVSREISSEAAEQVYRMALLGEKLTHVLVAESVHG